MHAITRGDVSNLLLELNGTKGAIFALENIIINQDQDTRYYTLVLINSNDTSELYEDEISSIADRNGFRMVLYDHLYDWPLIVLLQKQMLMQVAELEVGAGLPWE